LAWNLVHGDVTDSKFVAQIRRQLISPGYVNTPMTQGGMANKEWYDRWLRFAPLRRVGGSVSGFGFEQLFHQEQSCGGWGILLLVIPIAQRCEQNTVYQLMLIA
jgi:hypothetical protein